MSAPRTLPASRRPDADEADWNGAVAPRRIDLVGGGDSVAGDAGDVNGDGYADVLVGHDHSAAIYFRIEHPERRGLECHHVDVAPRAREPVRHVRLLPGDEPAGEHQRRQLQYSWWWVRVSLLYLGSPQPIDRNWNGATPLMIDFRAAALRRCGPFSALAYVKPNGSYGDALDRRQRLCLGGTTARRVD